MSSGPSRLSPVSALRALPLLIVLIAAAAALFEPRRDDFISLYSRIQQEIGRYVLGLRIEDGTPQYAKDLPVQGLEHMLASTSPILRATAVRAIGDRGEETLVPQLISLLNDNTLVEGLPGQMPNALAQLAKQALVKVLRNSMTKSPANIAVLVPFIKTAAGGTYPERKGCIEIIGDMKEPLGVPLLAHIEATDEVQGLRTSARQAINQITESRPTTSWYGLMRGTQLQVMIVMFGSTIVLLGFMLRRLFRAGERQFGVFTLIPIVLCGGIGSLVTADYVRGTINEGSINRAVITGDGMVLRTMFYHDYDRYPGRAGVDRLLLQLDHKKVFDTLNHIELPEPDDFDHLKLTCQQRIQWIKARIVAPWLNSTRPPTWIASSDPKNKLAVIDVLDSLAVTNERAIEFLEGLSIDSDRQVAEKARETIERSKEFAHWPNIPARPAGKEGQVAGEQIGSGQVS